MINDDNKTNDSSLYLPNAYHMLGAILKHFTYFNSFMAYHKESKYY